MNCGVWLITCGQQSAVGDPIMRTKRYQDCAMQSFEMPGGISALSSSAEIEKKFRKVSQ